MRQGIPLQQFAPMRDATKIERYRRRLGIAMTTPERTSVAPAADAFHHFGENASPFYSMRANPVRALASTQKSAADGRIHERAAHVLTPQHLSASPIRAPSALPPRNEENVRRRNPEPVRDFKKATRITTAKAASNAHSGRSVQL